MEPPTLTSHELARLKARAQDLPVGLQVGKSGLTEGLIKEIDERLRREDLLKVRLLRSAREEGDKRDMAREIAERAHATLVEVRGHTIVLYRPSSRRGRSRA